MADIGLNPPKRGPLHSRTGVIASGGATGAQFGAVVVSSGTASHADVATTTNAGDPLVMGVITSQGDPNNSGAFIAGDEVSIADLGDAQVLCESGTASARGDRMIASSTAGLAKKYGAETGDLCVIGECLQDVTTGANPQLVSVRLLMQRVKY